MSSGASRKLMVFKLGSSQSESIVAMQAPESLQPRTWRASRLRTQLTPCLARDAMRRPSAAAVVQTITGAIMTADVSPSARP